jgi:hypothetical protein
VRVVLLRPFVAVIGSLLLPQRSNFVVTPPRDAKDRTAKDDLNVEEKRRDAKNVNAAETGGVER